MRASAGSAPAGGVLGTRAADPVATARRWVADNRSLLGISDNQASTLELVGEQPFADSSAGTGTASPGTTTPPGTGTTGEGTSVAVVPGKPVTLTPTTTTTTGTGTGTGRMATRVRIRLPRVQQVRGRESTPMTFAVVAKGTSGGKKAGRAIVKIDGRTVKTYGTQVTLTSGKQVAGKTFPIPTDLGFGVHRIQVFFKPTNAGRLLHLAVAPDHSDRDPVASRRALSRSSTSTDDSCRWRRSEC